MGGYMRNLLLKLSNRQRFAAYKKAAHHLKAYSRWISSGRRVPPPHVVKQLLIRTNAAARGIGTLIESGTFRGDMVDAMIPFFEKIVSIELADELAAKASERFASFPHVLIQNGDSSALLPQALDSTTGPCIFWLDGHYSGGDTARGETCTPVWNELAAILKHPVKQHVTIIDDARLFVGSDDYPSITEVESFVKRYGASFCHDINDDVIIVSREGADWITSESDTFLSVLKADVEHALGKH